MKTKEFTRNKIAGIIMYVLSILVLLYFFYAAYVSISYVGTLMQQGQVTVGKDIGQVIQYVMTNAFSYLFYSICFAFFGFAIKGNDKKEEDVTVATEDTIATEK